MAELNNTIHSNFEKYTKPYLQSYASYLKAKGISKLKKSELIDAIVKAMLTPDIMFYRLSIFDDATMKLFEKAIGNWYEYSEEDSQRAAFLGEYDYVILHAGSMFVPEEVAQVYKEINNTEFNSYRQKASWLWKCLNWVQFLYGYAPYDVVLKLANTKRGLKFSESQLLEIYDNLPHDLLYVYKLKEVFISDIYTDNLDALEYLRDQQADKDYYIPSEAEIEEFFNTMALVSDPAYQKMIRFLVDDLDMYERDAQFLASDLWTELSESDDLNDTMQWFFDNLKIKDEEQLPKLMDVYNETSNSTRMIQNRGFKPVELLPSEFAGGRMPTIVPESSQMAEMLAHAAPKMRNMGFNVDLEGNADTLPVIDMPYGLNGEHRIIQKKIYPNDPCPCGSGKKYKKCCGR